MDCRLGIVSIAGALLYSASVSAATLIDFVDGDGETATMWVEGAKMRMDAEGG